MIGPQKHLEFSDLYLKLNPVSEPGLLTTRCNPKLIPAHGPAEPGTINRLISLSIILYPISSSICRNISGGIMKVILSRKGFDSSYGGYPSPILPDGRMVSLPIPLDDDIRYFDLNINFPGRNGAFHISLRMPRSAIIAKIHGKATISNRQL